jgi:heme/copper-type cytochrome/quinol oxidase subunit 2
MEQSLTNSTQQEAQPQPEPIINIKDNAKRAKHLIIVFWVLIGITVIALLSGYLEVALLQHVQDGGMITDEEATSNDNRQAIIGILQTVIYIVTIVFFLMWFRRAYGNLHRLGLKYIKHTESWAIWSFIVPIISLYRPVQIMNEIVEETQHKIRKMDRSYIKKELGLFIGIWWTLFIISNFVGRYVMRTAFNADTIEAMVHSSQAYLISDGIQMVEALMVILIVTKVSKIESKLAKEVQRAGGTVTS